MRFPWLFALMPVALVSVAMFALALVGPLSGMDRALDRICFTWLGGLTSATSLYASRELRSRAIRRRTRRRRRSSKQEHVVGAE